MPSKFILLLIGSLIICAGACGGTGEATNEEAEATNHQSDRGVPEGMGNIDPNEARILATVTAIYDTRSASGTCALAACEATIRIDSVLGYGSSFPRPLSKGEHLEARFAFTLSSTAEADIQSDRQYPGLKSGESFWADLQGRPVPGGTSFAVHEYHPAHE